MQNARLDEAQVGIKVARRNINTSDVQMTPTLWQKKKEDLKSLLMKVKEESEYPRTPKSEGAQVPFMKRRSICI